MVDLIGNEQLKTAIGVGAYDESNRQLKHILDRVFFIVLVISIAICFVIGTVFFTLKGTGFLIAGGIVTVLLPVLAVFCAPLLRHYWHARKLRAIGRSIDAYDTQNLYSFISAKGYGYAEFKDDALYLYYPKAQPIALAYESVLRVVQQARLQSYTSAGEHYHILYTSQGVHALKIADHIGTVPRMAYAAGDTIHQVAAHLTNLKEGFNGELTRRIGTEKMQSFQVTGDYETKNTTKIVLMLLVFVCFIAFLMLYQKTTIAGGTYQYLISSL